MEFKGQFFKQVDGSGDPLSHAAKKKEGKIPVEESVSVIERRGKSKIKASKDGTAVITVVPSKDEKSKVKKIWPLGYIFSKNTQDTIDPQ